MAALQPTRRLALLRGINVGGRNKVPMAELRALASGLGYTDVATYIASGNLLFTATGTDADVTAALAAAIIEEFGFAVDVVVADADLVRRAASDHPFADGDPKRVHVGFCSVPVTDGVLASLRAIATASERVDADGRLLWLDFADGVHASKLAARLTTALKPGFTTARNLATVRTLAGLLDA